MRLWSLHPAYLDTRGLVALWREALLAQKVLMGETRGYTQHPQLQRFRATDQPLAAIATYLEYVADEADRRQYNFNRSKILEGRISQKLAVTRGQLAYESVHLLNKLRVRDISRYEKLKNISVFDEHPLFYVVNGEIEPWERPN